MNNEELKAFVEKKTKSEGEDLSDIELAVRYLNKKKNQGFRDEPEKALQAILWSFNTLLVREGLSPPYIKVIIDNLNKNKVEEALVKRESVTPEEEFFFQLVERLVEREGMEDLKESLEGLKRRVDEIKVLQDSYRTLMNNEELKAFIEGKTGPVLEALPESELAMMYLNKKENQGFTDEPQKAIQAVLWSFNVLLQQEEITPDNIKRILKNLNKKEAADVLTDRKLIWAYEDKFNSFAQLVEQKGNEKLKDRVEEIKVLQEAYKNFPKKLIKSFEKDHANVEVQGYIIEYLKRNINVEDISKKIRSLNDYMEYLNPKIAKLGASASPLDKVQESKLLKYLDSTKEKHTALKDEYTTLVAAERKRLGKKPKEGGFMGISDAFVRRVIEEDPESRILIRLYKEGKFSLIAGVMGHGDLVSSEVNIDINSVPEEDKNAWKFIQTLQKLNEKGVRNIDNVLELIDAIPDREAQVKFFKLYLLNAKPRKIIEAINTKVPEGATKEEGKQHKEKQEKISDLIRYFDVYDLYEVMSSLNKKLPKNTDKRKEAKASIMNSFVERVLIAEEPPLVKYSAKGGAIAAGGMGALALVTISIYCMTNHTEFAKKFLSEMFNVLAFSNITEAVRESIMTSMPDVSKDLATAIAQSVGILPTALLMTGVAFALTGGITYSIEKFSSEKRQFLTDEVNRVNALTEGGRGV